MLIFEVIAGNGVLKQAVLLLCVALSAYVAVGQDAVSLVQTHTNVLRNELDDAEVEDEHHMNLTGDLHVQNSTGKPIMWLHVSKTAGSFFCSCAFKQGLNFRLPHNEGKNCHFLDEDEPLWGEHDVWGAAKGVRKHEESCIKLEHIYKRNGIDVEGNENFLPHGRLCPNFHNILIVRDPIYRLVSHISMLSPQQIVTETFESVQTKWPWLSDNYLTRSLAGESVFTSGGGNVTQSVFTKAQETLRNFDDIFIQDDDLAGQIKESLGWECADVNDVKERNDHKIVGGTESAVEQMLKSWSQEDVRRLKQSNTWDYKLFEEAQQIQKAGRSRRSNRPGVA